MTTTDQSRSTSAVHTARAPAGLSDALARARAAVDTAHSLLKAAAGAGISDGDLLEAQSRLVGLKREADVALAVTSAEIARRSGPELGSQGLAKKQGFTNPATMIAAATGGSRRDADRLIHAGRAMANAQEPSDPENADVDGAPCGGDTPSHPWVARALEEGALSVDHAAQIIRMLDSVAGAAPAQELAIAEKALVERAAGLTVEQLTPVVARWRYALVEKDAHERQDRLERERYLVINDLPDGSVKVDGRLDPVTAAPIRAALESMVKDTLRRRRDGDPLAEDTRSNGQVRADALASLARHMLGCDAAPIQHATTTVVVRMTLDQLKEGAGVAQVDGSGAVPASRIRRIAVDAGYVPVVLGGASEPLDVGRGKRRFTSAQITALLERDGGCAMCGAPPSHCEAHHIEWWDRDRGATDLSNGLMLCVACHHLIHRQAWEIDASMDDVYFRPPASIDPQRRPRLGGVARFGVSPRDHAKLASTRTRASSLPASSLPASSLRASSLPASPPPVTSASPPSWMNGGPPPDWVKDPNASRPDAPGTGVRERAPASQQRTPIGAPTT